MVKDGEDGAVEIKFFAKLLDKARLPFILWLR
jgi:hypothetical protein